MALPQFLTPLPAKIRANPFSLVRKDAEEVSLENPSRSFAIWLFSFFLVGLLSLLAINTLLTQDAFVLQRLKVQANSINDQRDAVLQLLAKNSSPDELAAAATKLGMIPALNPEFIDLNSQIDNPVVKK